MNDLFEIYWPLVLATPQVLFVHRELDVFRIPPRTGAGGWRSGEWRLNDRIFTGRCRVVAQGDALEVRLEDPARCAGDAGKSGSGCRLRAWCSWEQGVVPAVGRIRIKLAVAAIPFHGRAGHGRAVCKSGVSVLCC